MNHKIQFTLVLLCIFNFICLSTQYGQVFVDEVQPAKTDVVYFNSATSENAQLGELNVQTLTISHPEGFIVEFPGSLGFGGSSHDLVGELGITFGASTTDSVSLTSTGPFTSLSQTIDISVGSAFIRSYDDMTFQSTRGVSFQSDFFNLDGLFGADIISSEENVNVQSGVEISSHSERIEIAADDQLFIGAKSGTVELQSGATVSSSSESMFLQGLLGTQLVARGNLTVYAEDTFNTYSAESYYSSLTTTSLSSTQNVDFTAADTLIFRSAGSSTVNAQSELYVAANGDDESSVNVISSNAISVGAFFANFKAFVVDVDAVEMNIAALILDMTSTERIAFGSDKTSSLFIVSQSDLTFSLADNSLGEISVDSFITELDSTTSSLITAAGDLKVVSSNIKSDATNITFTSNEFTAYSISQTGRLVYSINAGSQLTGNDSSIAARDQVISGQSSVTTTTTGTLNADFVQDLTVSAANDLLFEGSSLTVNAYDISYAAEGSVFVNGGDVSIASVTGPISFDAQNALSVQSASASFTSKYGDIKLQSLGDYSFTTSDSMNYESGDNLDFTAYGLQYSVDAAANLVFSLSSTTAADGYASFVSSLDFTFDAASYSFNAEDLLFAAGLDFSITAQQNVQLTSSDVISLVTLNHNEGGVSFTADQTISATATNGNLTLDSSAALSLSTTDFKIDTNVISFVSSQSITFNANTDLLFDSSTTSIDSTGNLVFSTQGTLDLHSSGLLSFLGSGNAYLSFGDLQQTAGMNNQFQSGQLAFTSSAATSMTTQNLNATASNPGQIISITSLLSGISFAAGNWSLQTGNLYVNGENYANSASYSMVVNAGDIALASREFNLASGNFSLNAGSIQYSTDAFLGSFTTSSDQLSLTSAEGVVLTSAGDITWNALKGDITVSTHDLTLKAFNSEGFYAQTDINFVAPGGSNDIEILANGATHLNAGADVTIFSQNDMLWQAQRSLVFRTVVDGIFLFAEQGNFGVDSAASILYEASDAVDLIAYNTNGNASASFLAKDSILLRTTRNGIYFKSEGFVPNSTTVGIELESTALQGDIAFDSNQGTIFIDAPYQITFDSLAKVDLISALYSVYTSKNDMTFDALKGGLNFNALAGVTITAGTPGNPADLSFIQPKSFYAISTSAIDIRSQGPVVGNAIEIKAANGSIEFTTADASDITLTAGNAQTFTAGKSYTIDSNEDIQAYTPGGPIIYNAVTKGSFVTEGGPIQITTQTGSLNGEIDITALTGDITFNSGNTAFFTAKQNMTFDAASSISIAAADGVFEVSASSADSVINAHAAGYIQIQSTGSRLVPYDGIYLEAANNIEIGTITTDTVSLNAVNYVIIGDVTRPIVTINAGGSTTVSGITATSDGLISVYTENNLLFDITGELEYTGSSYIKGFSSGPSTYTVQNDIDLSAATGAIKLEADVLQFTATNGIQATTSGDLHVDQYGDARYNKIQISGPKVDFSATQSMTWYDNYVDGDLTDTFTLVTSGAGSIAGLENEGGTMVFHANTLFSIQSGDLLTFTNQRSYGSTLFAATGTNSPITITSDTQSDIEVNSGDQIYTYGLSISYSTDDQLTFEAQDNTPNNDDENGDISFYSSNSINVTSQSDLTFTASQTAAIQTTSFDNEAGYPLDMISTDEFEISSAYNLLIQNTYNEGGSIEFTALSDITIENSNSNGVLVSFYADANLTVETTRDYTLNIPNGGFDQTVGSDISMVANGIDSVDDFGIQFITQSNEGVIDFRALFGSVEFTAQNSLTLSANLNTDTSVASDLEIESGLTGSLTSNGQINVAANNDITFEAYSASIILQSTDNMMFTATSSSSNLAFIANGIDDNGFFGMKFTSTDADASTLLTTSADLNIKSAESLVFEGQMIDMFVVSNIEFDSKFGDILVESAFNLTYLTNSNIEITSATQMEFISAGTVYANSDGSISFATNGDFSNLGVQTYGSDAAIYTYSSGDINFQAYDYFAARTPERVGADINVTSSLGRIEFHSQLDPGAITMNVVSYFGNVTLESTGDDGDIYFYSSYLDIQASGSVIIESTLNLGDTTPGIILNVGTTTTHSAALNYYANSVTFGTNTGNFELTAVDGSVGIQANGNANIYANTGLYFTNSGIDTNLNIQAESSSIRFYSTYSTIGTFATESVYPKVKIPHNDKPVTQSSLSYSIYESECYTGEMFYTSNVRVNGVNYINTSTGFLCYCTGSRTLQCAPFLTPSCSREITTNVYGGCLPNLLFQHRNA